MKLKLTGKQLLCYLEGPVDKIVPVVPEKLCYSVAWISKLKGNDDQLTEGFSLATWKADG